MKWSVFATLLLCLVHNLPAIADVIPVETAKEYAARILSSGLRSSSSVRLVKAVYSQSSLRTTEPVLYLFAEEENSGFAWIAADDAVQPLIGFSRINSIDLDHMPPALTELLDQYESEIIKARESNLPSLTNSMPDPDEWTEKRLETALWEQHDPYYLKTPLIEGRHCVTGCVPTALAIIMRYHRYPDRAHNGVSSYMGNPVSYPKIDWDLMPLEGPRNRKESDAVAQLMWEIGANAQSEYGLKATSTYISKGLDAMKNVFGYNPNATYIEAKGLSFDAWKIKLRQEIDYGRPVWYNAKSDEDHAFICDGYMSDNYFHMNFGWGTSGNGYYRLPYLQPTPSDKYYNNHSMIVGLQPGTSDVPTPNEMRCSALTTDYQSGSTYFQVSLGIRNIGPIHSAGQVSVGLVKESGVIEPVSGPIDYNLPKGYQYDNPFVFMCSLLGPLSEGERIYPIFREGNDPWMILPCASDTYSYIEYNGPVKSEPTADDRPFISITENGFDNFCIETTLDWSNPGGIGFTDYYARNVSGPVTIRYTVDDYEKWKGHIRFYTKEDPNKGDYIPHEISDDGSVTTQIYIDEVKEVGADYYVFASDIPGTLTYQAEILLGDNICFRETNLKEIIVPRFGDFCSKDPIPLTKDIPTEWYCRFSSLQDYIGQQLGFNITLPWLRPVEYKLEIIRDGKWEEVKLRDNGNSSEPFDPILFDIEGPEMDVHLRMTLHRNFSDNPNGSFYIQPVRLGSKQIAPSQFPWVEFTTGSASATEAVSDNNKPKVSTTPGGVKLELMDFGRHCVTVVDPAGRIVYKASMSNKYQEIHLATGIYWIVIDDDTFKIAIR